jgi:hypothetical protein
MARSPYVRGQLPVVPAGRDRPKKQSQSKPLTSSAVESIRYAISEQNKAIDVNRLFFNYLCRQKADFSRRMNGARAHKSRMGEEQETGVRSQESGARSQKERSQEMLKNAVRSHHIVENKGSRLGTNPNTNPPKPNSEARFAVYDEQNKTDARRWVRADHTKLFEMC